MWKEMPQTDPKHARLHYDILDKTLEETATPSNIGPQTQMPTDKSFNKEMAVKRWILSMI